VAAALNNLAELNRIEARWEDSQAMFEEALEILRRKYGENHPAVGTALHNLAGCRLAQDDVDGAYDLYAKSLARKEATLGTNHPEYATTLYHMAEVLCRSDRKEDAIVLLERSIKVSEEIGAAHTDACARRMKRLAQLLWECERFEDAERVRRRILSTLEHMNGIDHVKIAGACESLALVLMKLGRLAEATSLLERSAKILARVRGDGGALALASTRLHLAEAAQGMGNDDKALKFCRLALEILSPSALDAVRRDGLRPEIRVGVVVQHARAAALLCELAPDDATGDEHARNAAQNLVAVKAVPGIDRRVLDSIDRAEFNLTRASRRVRQ
jgi:tetratricopeptide (TPR) repeat protein